jgi:hypothetical protein
MRRVVLAFAFVFGALFIAGAGATTTTFDANGTALLNGAKLFPIVLAKGPPRTGTTPTGADALNDVVGAGVNFFKVGPATTAWTNADVTDANLWDQAVASRGAYTWVNLSTLSQATPGSSTDSLLQQVVTTLLGDPTGSAGIGMWKGADEPWWSNIAPAALQFAYCRSTSRGDATWCGSEPWLDQTHLWVTIEAPKGTASDLSPYSSVTDSHGVDDYPVTLAAGANPDLHQVGAWTSTISAATPTHSVWTTLQVCASGSYDANGNYVLPTRLQERYMIYDAIVNGARNLAFYGGNNVNCMNATDAGLGWNWTFWDGVLKGLVQEINAGSPLAPALVNPGTTQTLTSSDSTTEVISRQGSTTSDLWVIAARSGSGSQSVTISGLPAGVTGGSVYTENRSVAVSNGSLTDTFDQWGVHVYHLTSTAPAPTPAPTISSFSPASGAAGTSVTISGTNLTGATGVSFSGTAAASYTVNSDSQVTATVPASASSGPISVTAAGGSATSQTAFTVTTLAAPDFSLTAAPSSQTVTRGASTSYTISVTPSGGFTSAVNLAVTGLPPGATGSFTPNPTTGTSTLTVQTSTTGKSGTYTLTITGTSSNLKHTATVTLQVRRK